MAKSETGVWIDDATGELVTSPPRNGTQIVQKGGEISSAARQRLAAAGFDTSDLAGFNEESKDETPLETATEDGDVETATVDDEKPKAKKAAKAAKK